MTERLHSAATAADHGCCGARCLAVEFEDVAIPYVCGGVAHSAFSAKLLDVAVVKFRELNNSKDARAGATPWRAPWVIRRQRHRLHASIVLLRVPEHGNAASVGAAEDLAVPATARAPCRTAVLTTLTGIALINTADIVAVAIVTIARPERAVFWTAVASTGVALINAVDVVAVAIVTIARLQARVSERDGERDDHGNELHWLLLLLLIADSGGREEGRGGEGREV